MSSPLYIPFSGRDSTRPWRAFADRLSGYADERQYPTVPPPGQPRVTVWSYRGIDRPTPTGRVPTACVTTIAGLNHGKESRKYNQDCTICRSLPPGNVWFHGIGIAGKPRQTAGLWPVDKSSKNSIFALDGVSLVHHRLSVGSTTGWIAFESSAWRRIRTGFGPSRARSLYVSPPGLVFGGKSTREAHMDGDYRVSTSVENVPRRSRFCSRRWKRSTAEDR